MGKNGNEEIMDCEIGENSSVGVRISTSSGFWPEENLYFEANLNQTIAEVLKLAAEALNLAITEGFVARTCQHKDLDVTKSFRQSGLRCLVSIHYTKHEKGGGGSPLISKEIFDAEISKISEKFLRVRNWRLLDSIYPNVMIEMNSDDKDPLLVEVNLADYPSTPASFKFRNSEKKPLVTIHGLKTSGFINQSNHPQSDSAFICAPGAREYHTHSSHTNDNWDNYRNRLNEFGFIPMLDKISNFWIAGGSQ